MENSEEDFVLEKTANYLIEENLKKGGPEVAPVNLRDRLEQAAAFNKIPIPEEAKTALVWIIREQMQKIFTSFEVGEEDKRTLEEILGEYEKGTKSLEDINRFTNRFLEGRGEEDEDKVLTKEIIKIKHKIYQAVKGWIGGELALRARSLSDRSLDQARDLSLEKTAEESLRLIRELLEPISKFRASKITCRYKNSPDRTGIEFSEGEISEPDIKFDELEWEKYKLLGEYAEESSTMEYAVVPLDPFVQTSDPLKTVVVFKMQLGDEKIGYIQFEFDGNDIHSIVKKICAHITAVLDTFVDVKLQQKLDRDIADKRREILKNGKITDWKKMCADTCELLSEILGRAVRFECKRFDVESDEMWSTEATKNISEEKGKKFPITLEFDSEEVTQMGCLTVQCKTPSEQKIIETFKGSFEQILQRREEKRYTFIKATGLTAANAYLDGNRELLRRMQVGVLYADIVGFSKITKELHEAALREEIEEDTVAKIINEFVTEIAARLERKYGIAIDKFVGDELIAIYGGTREKGEEMDVRTCLETLNDVGNDMQEDLRRIATEVGQRIKEEYNIGGNYPKPEELKFSYGLGLTNDLVGMLGDPQGRYSRVDFTVIGDDMNALARVLNAAGAGEKLMPKKSWDKYEKMEGEKLVKVGEAFLIEGKNIGLIEVVQIEKAEVQKRRLDLQRELIAGIDERFKAHKAAGGKNKPLFSSEKLQELPDGIYEIEYDKKPSLGKYKAKLIYREGDLAEGFTVEIPSALIEPIELYVMPEVYKKLEKEGKDMVLHKRVEKFILIKYRSIEDKVGETIEKMFARNKFLGRNKTEATVGELVPGEWKLEGHWEDVGMRVFKLSRTDKIVHLVLPKGDKAIRRMPAKGDKTLVLKDGLIEFKAEYPNWYDGFKVRV